MTQQTIKKLHPTLKKCKCGFISQRTQLYNHLERAKRNHRRPSGTLDNEFFRQHGEVPLNEDEGEKFQNAAWLVGTPKGYND